MQSVNLKLMDKRQADQVKQFLQQHHEYGTFQVEEGSHDAFSGGLAPDNHLQIRTTDMQALEHALDEHFNPIGQNWRNYHIQ